MVIKSVRIQNFRSLRDVTIECDVLTAAVGRNGAGKSTFLRALELFYATSPRYTAEDFYAGQTDDPIRIRVQFDGLTLDERERFSSHMQGDFLTVEKVLSWPSTTQSQLLYGWTLRHADFEAVRRASGVGKRTAYEELRRSPRYEDLPKYTNKEKAEDDMSAWEAQHPDDCTWAPDDGRFFGFTSVGQHNLSEHTRFILVPAVRDAAQEAAESRGSAVYEIMELVVRSQLARRGDIEQLRQETEARYHEMIDPSNCPELGNLEADLTNVLRTYVPDASVILQWLELDPLSLPLPRTQVKLLDEEGGYARPPPTVHAEVRIPGCTGSTR